jgi:hypothetical protein
MSPLSLHGEVGEHGKKILRYGFQTAQPKRRRAAAVQKDPPGCVAWLKQFSIISVLFLVSGLDI